MAEGYGHKKEIVSGIKMSFFDCEHCLSEDVDKLPTGETDNDEQLTLDRLKNLVENNRIIGARNILSTVNKAGVSKELNTWKRVLSEPKVKIGEFATGGDIREDSLWLRKNSSKYKGMWVALKNGNLLYSHKSRVELHRYLKKTGTLSGAVISRIGD